MANKKKKTKNRTRDSTSSVAFVHDWEPLLVSGYTPLSKNPQIIAAVKKIANLIGLCSIHLMENTDQGDMRLINGLSRLIDIDINDYQTRFSFMSSVVRTLLLEGEGNAVILPKFSMDGDRGFIDSLHLVPASQISFLPKSDDYFDYSILVDGREMDKDNLIHVVVNPDPEHPWRGTGYKAELKAVAKSLEKSRKTKDAFMESKWKPSVIVKVDAIDESFTTKEGRQRILDNYLETQQEGQPWILPADGFDVKTVAPLSLNDLALKDGIELDAKTIASILDVPSFFVGVGAFDKDEWNNFIQNRLPQITTPIEQTLTKRLLLNPSWYFRFNARSLMSWDIQTLAAVGRDLRQIGVMDGNEVRDMIGLSPREGLDDIVILENYLPSDRLGDQKKLKGGKEDGKEDPDGSGTA